MLIFFPHKSFLGKDHLIQTLFAKIISNRNSNISQSCETVHKDTRSIYIKRLFVQYHYEILIICYVIAMLRPAENDLTSLKEKKSNTKRRKRNKSWGCKFYTSGILW